MADDYEGIHPLIRRILEPEFAVVEAVLDGEALVTAVRTHRPEVLVVDIAMPRMNGIEAVRQILADRPHAVVMLTTHADVSLRDQAFRAGALGYVLKARAATDLAPAIRAALAGERFVSDSVEPS